jgi:DNA-binding NarL/FixJ family response regulator
MVGLTAKLELPAPEDLAVAHLTLDGEEYCLLSFPAPAWLLPAWLTPAAQEIVLLLLRGTSYRDIARQRATSARTVANQIAGVFRRLGVSSQLELARALLPDRAR